MCMKFWGVWTSAQMSQTMQPANPNIAEVFQYQTLQRSTNEPWKELYLERQDIKQAVNHNRGKLAPELDYNAISEPKVNNILWKYKDKLNEESGSYVFYISNYVNNRYYFPLKCFSIQIQMDVTGVHENH